MHNVGMHPNAVTYGHYNKAVLESTWPTASGEEADKTPGVRRWNLIRNVLRAAWAFRFFGKHGGLKVLVKVTKAPSSTGVGDGDTVSQTSSTEETKKDEEKKAENGEESTEETQQQQQQFQSQFRKRLKSIVKLVSLEPGYDEADDGSREGEEDLERTLDEAAAEVDDGGVKRKLEFESPSMGGGNAEASNKDDLGVSRLEEGEVKPKSSPRPFKKSLFEDGDEDSESVDSTEKQSQNSAESLEKLPAEEDRPRNAFLDLPTEGHALQKVGSTSSVRLPVTEADPLGALDSPPKDTAATELPLTAAAAVTPIPKSATCPVDMIEDTARTPTPANNRVEDDILGKPYTTVHFRHRLESPV